jgi:hypothetical protein
MEYAYMLGGGAPLFKRFQINETFANAGIPVLAPGADTSGVQISTTTSWANACGVTMDTATHVTAQQTDGTSAEREVRVIISPDACFRALMSGGATEGTALVEYLVTAAQTDGLTVTASALTWNAPAWDEGAIMFTSGVNQDQMRKVTGGPGTSIATVTVAFDRDAAVDDTFIRMPWWFMDTTSDAIQTTANLYQANALIAVGTGGDGKVIDMEMDGVGNSHVIFTFDDHVLNHSKAGIDG